MMILLPLLRSHHPQCLRAGCGLLSGNYPRQATLDQVLGQAMEEVGLQRLDLPEGVESVLRGEGDSQVRILLNHNEVPVHALGQELAPFQVKVLPVT